MSFFVERWKFIENSVRVLDNILCDVWIFIIDCCVKSKRWDINRSLWMYFLILMFLSLACCMLYVVCCMYLKMKNVLQSMVMKTFSTLYLIFQLFTFIDVRRTFSHTHTHVCLLYLLDNIFQDISVNLFCYKKEYNQIINYRLKRRQWKKLNIYIYKYRRYKMCREHIQRKVSIVCL